MTHLLGIDMRFERSVVWQRSKNMAVEVYKETKSIRDFGFRDQITRSILSVPSNISEGMERRTNKDIAHFLTISKASCAEFKTQTIIGAEIGYIDQTIARQWMNESDQICKMLGSFIKNLTHQTSS